MYSTVIVSVSMSERSLFFGPERVGNDEPSSDHTASNSSRRGSCDMNADVERLRHIADSFVRSLGPMTPACAATSRTLSSPILPELGLLGYLTRGDDDDDDDVLTFYLIFLCCLISRPR